MKYTVCIIVREAAGFREVPLRVEDNHEDAESAIKAYERRNPGLSFMTLVERDEPDEVDL